MIQIPQPVSRALPTEEDLRRDKLFHEDFDRGFLSRGVSTQTLETVKEKRHALVLQIHKVLVRFVKDMISEKMNNANKATTKISNHHSHHNNINRHHHHHHYHHHYQQQQQHPIFSHPDFLADTSCCCWADVRPYGSVAIEADLVDSDIDLVCLVPDFISRDDFLDKFPNYITISSSNQSSSSSFSKKSSSSSSSLSSSSSFNSDDDDNDSYDREDDTQDEDLDGLYGEELAVVRGAKVPVIRFVTKKDFTKNKNNRSSRSRKKKNDENTMENVFSSLTNNNINNSDNEKNDEEEEEEGFPIEVDLIFVGVNSFLPQSSSTSTTGTGVLDVDDDRVNNNNKFPQIRTSPPLDDEIIDVEICFGTSSNNNNMNNKNSPPPYVFIAPEYRMSINGVRTALELTQRLNPSTTPNAFRIVTSAIKNWAIVRGILGNNFAFPGGVSYAVLVMRILQAFPNDCCSGLLIKFFKFFHMWINGAAASTTNNTGNTGNNNNNNNKIKVVKLTDQLNSYPSIGRIPGMPDTWNTMNNSGDVFPVLNPAYPHLNTTYSMTASTLRAFAGEIRRGFELVVKHQMEAKKISDDENNKEDGNNNNINNNNEKKQKRGEATAFRAIWRSLYSSSYKLWDDGRGGGGQDNYSTILMIEVAADFSSLQSSSSTSSSSLFLEWCRFVESRLKFLLYSLDSTGEIECRPVCEGIQGSDFISQQGEEEKEEDLKIKPQHRRFFVIGVRSSKDNNNNNNNNNNSDNEKEKNKESTESDSRIASDNEALHFAISEFLFNISPESQGFYASSAATDNNNNTGTGNSNKKLFDPNVHGKILLTPQISIVQLMKNNNNANSSVVPDIDLETSALCRAHNDSDFLKKLLKMTIPPLSLVVPSSSSSSSRTIVNNNNNSNGEVITIEEVITVEEDVDKHLSPSSLVRRRRGRE